MNTVTALHQPNGGIIVKGYLRTAEVAKRFDVNSRTILRWVKDGYFPGAIKQNPHASNSPILIPEQAVEDFAQKQVLEPNGRTGQNK